MCGKRRVGRTERMTWKREKGIRKEQEGRQGAWMGGRGANGGGGGGGGGLSEVTETRYRCGSEAYEGSGVEREWKGRRRKSREEKRRLGVGRAKRLRFMGKAN